ncbi:6-pyruvoyl tetrahydropterin synthase family protein [Nocardia tengchongensis]|uniref:6-pyruvoyl trahydropterin synthase family protein n=1 Tax=Nocardia tengchongensis TaxID=2055889 RepID=UPI0036788BD5
MSLTFSISHTAEIAHRLTGAARKHRNVHGHSLLITWTFETANHGGGVDFGLVEFALRSWVEEYLDHGFVSDGDDPIGHHLFDQGLKVLYLPVAPTVDALAVLLADTARELVPGARLRSVDIQESGTTAATWSAA